MATTTAAGEPARRLFRAWDLDNNGWLSHTEVKRAIRAHQGLRKHITHSVGHHWQQVFDKLDTNHDGRIEEDELVAFFQRYELDIPETIVNEVVRSNSLGGSKESAGSSGRSSTWQEAPQQRLAAVPVTDAAQHTDAQQREEEEEHQKVVEQRKQEHRQHVHQHGKETQGTGAVAEEASSHAEASSSSQQEARPQQQEAAASSSSPATAATATPTASGAVPSAPSAATATTTEAKAGAAATRPSMHEQLLEEATAILARQPRDGTTQLTLYQQPPAWGLCSSSPVSIAIQAFCTFHQIPFQVVSTTNTAMSTRDTLPFVRVGVDRVLETPAAIFDHLTKLSLPADASTTPNESSADFEAFLALVTPLFEITDVLTWDVASNRASVASAAVAGVPWPLQPVLSWVRWATARRVHGGSAAAIEQEADDIYCAIAARLAGGQPHIVGDRFTFVDAVMYAHVAWVTHAPLKHNPLKPLLSRYPAITSFYAELRRILD